MKPEETSLGQPLEAYCDAMPFSVVRDQLGLSKDTPLMDEDTTEFNKYDTVQYAWDQQSAERKAEVYAYWAVIWAKALRKAMKETEDYGHGLTPEEALQDYQHSCEEREMLEVRGRTA